MDLLNKHSPVSVPEGLSELQKVAVGFEEKVYASATSQSDNLWKIPLKMLSMESQTTNIQQNPQNAQVVQNQRLRSLENESSKQHVVQVQQEFVADKEQAAEGTYFEQAQASEDNTAQSDDTGAGSWQEEIYQKIKTMKNQYLPELGDLCNKISMKLQHINNHMPAEKFTQQYVKMKQFKEIYKDCVHIALKYRIPACKRQIVYILDSQKRKPVETFLQPAGPSYNTSRIPVGSAGQTGNLGAGDLPDELDQMNTNLKDQYLAGNGDLCEISRKLHADSHMASQKPTDQSEQTKSFNKMLERSLHSLQIGKGSVQLDLEGSIPMHKRQIISTLSSEGCKPDETLQQSAGQASSSSSSGGVPPPERSNVKKLKPCLKDDSQS